MRRLLLLAIALGCGGGLCGPGGVFPNTMACFDAPDAGVGALELGSDAPDFTPLADGTHAKIVQGGQGGSMLLFRIRVTATPPPSCVAQTTTVTDASSGAVLGMLAVAISTSPDGAGGATSNTIYLIYNQRPASGTHVVVTTTVGGQSVQRNLILD